jgi:hypothetical protein
MSDIQEMLSRISSMKDSEDSGGGGGSGGSGGGGVAEGFHPGDGAGNGVRDLNLTESEVPFLSMLGKSHSLDKIFQSGASLNDLIRISAPLGINPFEIFDRFLPINLKNIQLLNLAKKGALDTHGFTVGVGLKNWMGNNKSGGEQQH